VIRTTTRRRLHAGRLPLAVLTLVLALTIGGWFLAERWVDQREQDALEESSGAAVAVVSSFARQIEAILYAGSVIADAAGGPTTFERTLGDRIEGTAITSISLLEPTGGRYTLLAAAGSSSPLLVSTFPGTAVERLDEIARSDGQVRVVEIATVAAGRVVGFATSAGDGRRVVYAESLIPQLEGLNTFLRLPQGVQFATYLEPPGPDTLLQATTDELPLAGRTVTEPLQLGDERAVLVVGGGHGLVGRLTAATPWIVLAAGVVLAVVFALVLELTQRRREAETQRRALEEQNERLRELDGLKDELVATVSHELRTPLTSILGYLELVRDEPDGLSEEQQSFLDVVERNARRLLNLVSDLLFVARIDSGRVDLETTDVELDALAAECVAGQRLRAEQAGVELALAADGVPSIRGDRTRLMQLVDNLLSNAIKFTPTGGRVDVRVTGHKEGVALEVADTGMGISDGDQKRLYERFFRTRAAGEAAIQGTGLGLTIAKAIVDAHEGTISVESGEGKGTTFRVLLPVASATTGSDAGRELVSTPAR